MFEIRHTVTFEETNLVGNVYYANYFLWQGRCREMFLYEKAPATLAELQAGRLRLVTAHASCDFVEECTAFDEIMVRMRLREYLPFGVSLEFEYGRAGEQDDVLARGRQDIKFLRCQDGAWALCEVPGPLLRAVQAYE